MAKPEIIVNGGSPGAKAAVSASAAWTATLDSTDGVRQVEWSVSSTDETTTAGSYTLVQSGSVGQNVAGTAQGQGTGIILHVSVNAGVNAATGQADPENTSATVKIYVPLADGGEVGCAGEEYESDPTFGATGIINAGIRKAAALSPSGVPVKIVRAATAAALPTNTRSGNVLTASSNGAIGTVGGVATLADGDYILVQNEGGGASHVNNGAYVLADGDGSNPWTLTRATYFDDSAELIAMTTFRIQEGTYAGKERYLVTSGATINVTALEFAAYGYAPNDAAFLTVGAVSDLSAERNISAVGTTLTFESTTTTPLGAKRTSSTTADFVDAQEVTALSSGAAAAGFGPSVKFLGEVSGGGAENYGRLGFAATDLTGGSEDTKFVAQARTAGSALATVFEASGTSAKLPGIATGSSGLVAIAADGTLSRTASAGGLDATAHVLEDASTALGANGVPIRALPSVLAFAKTSAQLATFTVTAAAGSVYEAIGVGHVVSASGAGTAGDGVSIAARLVDATPSARQVGRIRWEWISPVALTPRADFVVSVLSTDGEHDWLRLTDAGALVLPAYNIAARRPIFAGTDGTITATAIQSAEVTTALGYTPVTNARTLTGTSPITVAGDNSAHDLSADRTIAFAPTANVAWGGYGITGIASLDNSGSTLDLGANTTAQNVGKSGTTWAIRGAATVAETLGVSGVVTFTGDAVGSTQTRGVTLINNTVSSTQYTRQLGFTAFHSGGTQWNMGTRLEVVNASRARQITYYGSGSGVPSSEILRLDSQDDNFGALVRGPAFASSGYAGYRFDIANNRGGLKQDSGTNYISLESYNTKDLRFYTGADSGGSSGVLRMIWNGSGQGYAQFVPTTPTSSGNAVTFNLTTSQNVEHTLTENTTVTITGGVNGQRGTIVISQPASGKTVTMPTNGSGVEYDNTILALGGGTYEPAIVDTTAFTRTVLNYYVLANGKAFIYSRSVAVIP